MANAASSLGGDRKALHAAARFRAIVEEHRAAVARHLSRLGVPAAEIDDALQDVLLVAASKIDRVPAGGERAFLFATALRVASNARRGLHRRLRKQDVLLRAPGDPIPSAEDLTDQLRARQLLDDALEQMSTESRMVFLLHEVHELPLADVAARLALPEGTVASRLRRARASFDEWAARTAAAQTFARATAATHTRSSNAAHGGDPEVLSWWARGGEADALRALVRVFERSHPNSSVRSAAVPATSVAKQQLVSRMSRGRPPDTFQVNGGIDLLRWVRRGGARDEMESLDFLFASEHWTGAFPRDVIDLVSHAGRIYAVPLNIHRTNALFFDKRVFERHGLRPPETLGEMHETAEALRARGVVPFAIGFKDPWTLTMLAFENVMVAVAGGDYYRDFFTGRRQPADPELRATLAHVERILDYSNDDAAAIEWDEAVDRLRTARAAMTIMGDWAKGFLASRGWIVDRDFGEVASPGARGSFVFATDTFGLPRHASHRAGAIELLKVFGSREGQDAFNPIKGSIPARTDVDLSPYDPLARATARDFAAARRHPTLSSLAPLAFTRALDAAMARFARDRDAGAVVAAVRAHYDLLAR